VPSTSQSTPCLSRIYVGSSLIVSNGRTRSSDLPTSIPWRPEFFEKIQNDGDLKITRANAVAPMALSVPIGEALHVVMSSYDEGERVAMP